MRERLVRDGEVDYQVERSNARWADHQARTLVTAALIAWLKPESVLDPACGDASIVAAANLLRPIAHVHLADISEPSVLRVPQTTGFKAAVSDIFDAIEASPNVDVVVLTETLEHLADPDQIAALARGKGRYLVASSPVMRAGQVDHNSEHLWMFDRTGYEAMLTDAGWRVEQFTFLSFPSEYDFGVWVCR